MTGSRHRPRTVVDTNLFVSATLFERGNPYALRRAWLGGDFELLLSADHYAELVDVFDRPRLIKRYRVAAETLTELFMGLASATRIQPSPTIPVHVRDSKDVKILAAAIGGDADYLVTGDADLLVHRNDLRLGKLGIVTVSEFLAILDQLTPDPSPAR